MITKDKGISLSINTLIIFIAALIVFMTIITFFTNIFEPSSNFIDRQTDIDTCCARFIDLGGCTQNASIELECFDELEIDEPVNICC